MHIRLFFLLAIATLGLQACAQSPDCFQNDVFCAALVTDTRGLNDFGASHEAWAGLQQSHADGVVDQVAYIESVNAKDYEKNIAYFVDSGYDVIITSSPSLREATLRSTDLYPDTVFIGLNQPDDSPPPNFIPVTFPEDQMGFFAGALAAHLTRRGKVGAVCEASGLSAMWQYCEGFRTGAQYADETVKVLVVYHDGESSSKLFIDDAWGYENAQKLIEADVDVLFAVGGETAVGALRAAQAAKIQAIGAERDQSAALAGEGVSVVTSVLGRTSFTVQEWMRKLKNGNQADTELHPFGYIPFDRVVSQGVVKEMDDVIAGLKSGEIKVDIPLDKP